MKNRIAVIGLICAVALCACGRDKENSDTVSLSQEEYDDLMKRVSDAQEGNDVPTSPEEDEEFQKFLEDEDLQAFMEEQKHVYDDADKNRDNGATENPEALKKFFPYPVSDEIKNSTLMDGTLQIYKEVFKTDFTMTPEDVANILKNSDRKDLFDVEISYDNKDIPCGVKVAKIGGVGENLLKFSKGDQKRKAIFDDESVELTFGEGNGYYLVGTNDIYQYYYMTDEDNIATDGCAPDLFYGGGISSKGHKIDGSKWDNEEVVKELERVDFIKKPEGIVRDDSEIKNAAGIYQFIKYANERNCISAIKHIPKLDTYEFTYTMDKVEYIEHYTGWEMVFLFESKTSVYPNGIDSIALYYRGKEALDRIESKLPEIGLESKYSQEIHDAHIND